MLVHSILQEIRRVLRGEQSHDEFEEWLLSRLNSILSSGEEDAIAVANELDAMFVELGEDLLGADEFDARLAEILQREESTVRITIGTPTIRAIGQHTVHKKAELPGRLVTHHLEYQEPLPA